MAELIALEQKNVQKLTLSRIEGLASRPVTKILGENGQGKSTVLNLLFWLFHTKYVPKEVIKHGEKSASITGEFDIPDEELVEFNLDGGTYIVRKLFSPSGATLKVYPKDNRTRVLASPQDFVNRVLATVGFNPLEFCDADIDKQQEMLLNIVGLTDKLKALEDSYGAAYKEREGINREAKQLKVLIDQTPEVEHHKRQEFSDIITLRNEAAAFNAENKGKRDRLAKLKQDQEDLTLDGQRLKNEKESLEEQIASAQRRLTEVEAQLETKRNLLKDSRIQMAALETVVKKLVDTDLSEFDNQVKFLEENNLKADQYTQRQALTRDWNAKKSEAAELTNQMNANEAERAELLKNAKYPLKGLEYSDEGVRYKGTLIESLSRAEKLLVGLSIMSSLHPKLKLAIIDDGERLVGESRKVVQKWAEKTGIHVLLAIAAPADTNEDGILIEDGDIVRATFED